ncbi:MAG: hypothetical protein HOL80_01520 [Candidatus Magasanikbacteria bacterium]|jgi:hypothetical protein|nr:hypothetical protein [Candidatus Magasanikbacteria bacterium]MBT6294123.1 hypothetical protein [Candidatus Magasanikbacteria bacterium]
MSKHVCSLHIKKKGIIMRATRKKNTKPAIDRQVEILKREIPRLLNDILILVGKPVKLIFDPTIDTAATDCVAEVRMGPWFFLEEGYRMVGFGTAYHECGHIRHSPYGVDLLQRAHKQGGPVRQQLMNIVLDRKDDMLTAQDAPGFAPVLRDRLQYICTLGMKERYKKELKGLTHKESIPFLRKVVPEDIYEDFFMVAKWHRRPKIRRTFRAKKYMTRRQLLSASPDRLCWLVEQIHRVLGDVPHDGECGSYEWRPSDDGGVEKAFAQMAYIAACQQARFGDPEHGETDVEIHNEIEKIIQNNLSQGRAGSLQQLEKFLKTWGITHPGTLSVGEVDEVEIRKIKQHAKYTQEYLTLLGPVRHLVDPLKKRLRLLDSPKSFTLYGQDEGDEIDDDEVANIALNIGGYFMTEVDVRDINAEIHLAIDCSGSMSGEKVKTAKQIAILFSEAIQTFNTADCVGSVWGYSSEAIYDFGEVSQSSGLVTLEGEAGNSDTHLLRHVGACLARSTKRRKILFVLCDDGPDCITGVQRISNQLLSRGILVIHLLVGVHAAPKMYPIELLFLKMEDCLKELGDVLETVLKHMK